MPAVYLLTRNLWWVIGLHLGWNLFEGPVFGAQISGRASFCSGASKIEKNQELVKQGLDCLWPSSVAAQNVFQAMHKNDFPEYRAETVLSSPEVIYAGSEGTNALQKLGPSIKTGYLLVGQHHHR